MSQEYDNTNRWALFKNDRKEKDTQPDYTGSLNVDGVEYYLDAWLKEGSKGKFFSGKIKPKAQPSGGNGAKSRSAQAAAQASSDAPFPDDDIPF